MWRTKFQRLLRYRRGRTDGSRASRELLGGIYIDRLPTGSRVLVHTTNRQYLVEACGGCNVLISGHPQYCPEPVPAAVHGSMQTSSKIEPLYIGPGMQVEFRHLACGILRTSRVRDVRVIGSSDNSGTRD